MGPRNASLRALTMRPFIFGSSHVERRVCRRRSVLGSIRYDRMRRSVDAWMDLLRNLWIVFHRRIRTFLQGQENPLRCRHRNGTRSSEDAFEEPSSRTIFAGTATFQDREPDPFRSRDMTLRFVSKGSWRGIRHAANALRGRRMDPSLSIRMACLDGTRIETRKERRIPFDPRFRTRTEFPIEPKTLPDEPSHPPRSAPVARIFCHILENGSTFSHPSKD